MSSAEGPAPAPRRGLPRRVLRVGAVVVLGLVALAAASPALLSSPPGEALAVRALEGRVDGTVALEDLSVGWFSDQRVRGLHVAAPDGATSVDLDASLDRGLLPLALGASNVGTLTVAGEARGVRYADGTTSFSDLLPAEDEEEPDEEVEAPEAPGGTAGLVLDGLDVRLHDEASGEDLALSDLRGEVRYDVPGTSRIDVRGRTLGAGGEAGAVRVSGSVEGLAPGRGLAGSPVALDLTAEASGLPLAVVEAVAGLDGRLTSVVGEEVASLTARARGTVTEGARIDLDLRTPRLEASGAVEAVDQGAALSVVGDAPLVARLSPVTLPPWLVEQVPAELGVVPRADGDAGSALELRVVRARLPLPDGEDGALALEDASFATELTGSGLGLVLGPEGGEDLVQVDDCTFALETDDPTESVRATASASGPAGELLSADGTFRATPGEDGAMAFDPADARARLDARSLPTALGDAALAAVAEDGSPGPLSLEQLLGETLDVVARYDGLTPQGGTASLEVESANGSRFDGELLGRDEGFALARELTATLETGELLREQLLRRLQPVLGDVTSARGGLGLSVPRLWVPADGDLRRIEGSLRFEAGEVGFSAGSQFVRVLELARRPELGAYTAELDPVAIELEDGVARTEPFTLHLGLQRGGEAEQTLVFEGAVDLAEARAEELLGLYPVDALKRSIEELEDVPPGLRVGLEFSGPLYGTDDEPRDLSVRTRFDVEPEEAFPDLWERLDEELDVPLPKPERPGEGTTPEKKAEDAIEDALEDLFG